MLSWRAAAAPSQHGARDGASCCWQKGTGQFGAPPLSTEEERDATLAARWHGPRLEFLLAVLPGDGARTMADVGRCNFGSPRLTARERRDATLAARWNTRSPSAILRPALGQPSMAYCAANMARGTAQYVPRKKGSVCPKRLMASRRMAFRVCLREGRCIHYLEVRMRGVKKVFTISK